MAVLMCICGYTCGTKKAFEKHVAKFCGTRDEEKHGPTPRTQQILQLSDQFKYFDTSGDNKLDMHELGSLLKKGNPNISDREVEMLFTAADKDQDERVDFDEFLGTIYAQAEEPEYKNEDDGSETIKFGTIKINSPKHHEEYRDSLKSAPEKMSFGDMMMGGGGSRKSPKHAEVKEEPKVRPRFETDLSPAPSPTAARSRGRATTEPESPKPRVGLSGRGVSVPEKTPEPIEPTSPKKSSISSLSPGNSPDRVRSFSEASVKSPSVQSHSMSGSLSSTLKNVRMDSEIRLLIVRHGRSANKSRVKGEAASNDPELSEQGFEQAEALGQKLARDLTRIRPGNLIVASSPMKRCLLTIYPAIFKLHLARDDCICHGALYEFGCAGLEKPGTHVEEIAANFPEFAFTGFREDGYWDYRYSSARETEEEAKERAVVIVDWIWWAAQHLSQRGTRGPKVLIVSFHQTMADLVCQLLVDGTTDDWVYGEMKYKLFNTGVTELILEDRGGTARVSSQNDFSHLGSIGGPTRKSPPPIAKGHSERTGKMIAKLRNEFAKLDSTGDYKLDFNEMCELLRKGKPDMCEDQMWQIFKGCDDTNDGEIDFDEFLSFIFGSGAEMAQTLSFATSP